MFGGIRKALNYFLSPKATQQIVVQRKQHGYYDAAGNGDEYKNIWATADRYDADSANSKDVRHTLISRSRYEIANNGFSDGIAQTYATDLIGIGPSLRMQTGSVGLNQLIERKWQEWARAARLRDKLWTKAHAKHSDGESFGVIRRNPAIRNPVKLDLVLVEAEQCQTPWLPIDEAGYIDGIRFDDFGNPVWYEFLTEHPGSTGRINVTGDTEKVSANFVTHWFKSRRPGQHRGIPECASTLNAGAAARRWREATVAAAETAANFTVFIHTNLTPDEAAAVTPMSTLDIEKRMLTTLPEGYSPSQMKAEHPTGNYESFHKSLVNEQARPKSMPYNKAACDSSSYNYASGRLDHQTYYAALDVDRADCDEQVLDVIFRAWLFEAVIVYGWFGGNPLAISEAGLAHTWDWPKHRVADVQAEADSNKTKLQSGQISLPQLYSDNGYDLEDQIPVMAQTFGVDEAEIRRRLLDICLPVPNQGGAPGTQKPATEGKTDPVAASINRILPHINGNGVANGKH